jgi:hypothetical protein
MSNKSFESQIKEFYLVASEFCKLLENIQTFTKFDFLSNTQKLLNLLYLKASLVLKPKGNDEGEAEKFVEELDWMFIKDQVGSKLGLSDKYIELPLPENIVPDNIETISLSECFADIYQDLRDFSTNYEIGNDEAITASISECLDNFEKFWGIRALAILISIHHFIYGDEVANDNLIENNDDLSKNDSLDTSNWPINQRFKN